MIRPVIRPVIRIGLEIVGALLAGLLLAAGGVAWRLQQGPVEVDFLTPVVQEALSQGVLPSVRVTVGTVMARWGGWDDPVSIEARGFRVTRSDGAIVATVPVVGVGFDLRAVLRGLIAPTRIELIRPAIRVVRHEDGAIDLGIDDVAGADPTGAPTTLSPAAGPTSGSAAPDTPSVLNRIGDLIATLRVPPSPESPIGALTRLSIVDAELRVEDRAAGQVWRAPRADLELTRDRTGVTGHGRLDLSLSSRTVTTVEVELQFDSASGATRVTAKVAGIDPPELAARLPVLQPLAAAALRVSGRVELDLNAGFEMTAVRFEASAGPGTVTLPQFYRAPLTIAGAGIRGVLSPGDRRLDIESLSLNLGGPVINMSLQAADRAGQAEVKLRTVVTAMPVDQLAVWWPESVARPARRWITANLSVGDIDSATASAQLTVPLANPADADLVALDGHIDFDDVSVKYFKDLPAVTHVSGTATLSPSTCALALKSGHIVDAKFGKLKLGQSKVVINGLNINDQDIDIDVPITGPLAAALALLDNPPLHYAARFDLKPAGVTGTAETEARFKFPLEEGLDIDEVVVKVTSRLSGVSIENVVGTTGVSAGNFDLAVDNEHLTLSGQTRIADVPAQVEWTEMFSDTAPVATRMAVKGVVSDAVRQQFGADLAPYVTGPIGVNLTYLKPRAASSTVTVVSDLTGATVALPDLEWRKPPDIAGDAQFTVQFANKIPVRVTDIQLNAPGLAASGDIDLTGAAGHFARGHIRDLTLGETRVRGDVEASAATGPKGGSGGGPGGGPSGGYVVQLSGPVLDLRPVLHTTDADKAAAEKTGAKPPHHREKKPDRDFGLKLSADLGRVILGDGRVLSRVSGSVAHLGKYWNRIMLVGQIGDHAGPELSVKMVPEGALRQLTVESADAGATLRVFDIFDGVDGGHLSLTGTTDTAQAGTPTNGQLVVTDYTVHKAPILARLLNATSPRGLSELVNGGGIRFGRLDARYRHTDDDVIHISSLRTTGSSLGLTTAGTIDTGAETIDLEGTIVPLHDVNTLIDEIPVIGDLLAGGSGQGLFAATYHVRGALGDPDVSVNPLATLAPGFLRTLLFGGGDQAEPHK
ncbi:MAG: AsmA-like C-terminal domain-containing protein [Azospirillaceae bacterium]|nr:AsmA-like C-terminal domain-containing protein [Azospirillaceae bacterium]